MQSEKNPVDFFAVNSKTQRMNCLLDIVFAREEMPQSMAKNEGFVTADLSTSTAAKLDYTSVAPRCHPSSSNLHAWNKLLRICYL